MEFISNIFGTTPDGFIQVLIFLFLSLIPILGWIYFFQKKNREKQKNVVILFIAGMFSVIPMKLYQKYWDTPISFLDHINIFKYLENTVTNNYISELLFFVIGSVLVSISVFVFTLFCLGIFEVVTGDNSIKTIWNKFKKITEIPLYFITLSILIGIVGFILKDVFHTQIWFFVMVALMEEFIKHCVVRVCAEEKIKNIADAISYSIIAALGFAFIENIFYLNNVWAQMKLDAVDFIIFFVLRSSISVMGHVFFSGIMGFYYGKGLFAKGLELTVKKSHPIIQKIARLFHWKFSTMYHEEQIFVGLFLAMFTHAIFNSLLEFQKIFIIIPLLLIGFWWLIHFMKSHIVQFKFKRSSAEVTHITYS